MCIASLPDAPASHSLLHMTHVCLWKNAWKFHLNRTRFNQMTAILKIRTLYSARGYSKTGRSIFFNCSRPGSRNDLKFFSLCPCLYWAPATKVSSRPDENFLSERLYNRPHRTNFYYSTRPENWAMEICALHPSQMHQLHTLFCIWHMCVSGRMPENFI